MKLRFTDISDKIQHEENGSAIIQLILTIPFVLAFAIALFQFAVFNYDVMTLSSNVNRAVIATDVREYAQRLNANPGSANAVAEDYALDIQNSMPVEYGNGAVALRITNLNMEIEDNDQIPDEAYRPNSGPYSVSELSTLKDYNAYIRVTGKIEYDLPQFGSAAMANFFGIDTTWTVTRDINIVQTGSSRFEVSE